MQDTLETEYPLLDSSLLAAFISDLPAGVDSSHESFTTLRQILAQLSLDAQAEFDMAVTEPSDHSAFGSDDPFWSENSAGTSLHNDASPSASRASSTSTGAISTESCTSSLEFLHILFPQLSRTLLLQALHEHSDSRSPPDEPDLSAVLDHLLTVEYIQDLTERGFPEEAEVDSSMWLTATAREKHGATTSKAKPRVHTHKIPLAAMWRHRHSPRSFIADPAVLPLSASSTDPWMRLTSLATRLSELLHPTPPGFFMSYFHNPATQVPNGKTGWKSEGDAVRDALLALATCAETPVDEAAIEIVCDVALELNGNRAVQLDVEQRNGLTADARLCLKATRGDSGAAFDLMLLLHQLDHAFIQGGGVAHAVKPAAARGCTVTHTHVAAPPITPPKYPPPAPPLPSLHKHPPHVPSTSKDNGWKLVTPRRPASEALTHPHADFIPAYASRSPHTRQPVNGPETSVVREKGYLGELDLHSAAWYKARAGEAQTRRNEALHEATRHWQGGKSKNHGGEVALYYAEKARELQEQQKQWALSAARAMVKEKRTTEAALDLHGLTVAEARVIVTETLAVTTPTPKCPLNIITGRGSHSAGRVGVLGPAVHEMLRAAGWRVSAREGGLIVRERM